MKPVFRRAIPFFLPLVCAFNASAESELETAPLRLKQSAPETYTVVKGDTLWDISGLYLESSWLWPRLWQVNPEIDNPHLIYPGDKLSLTWFNGQPVLSLKAVKKLSPKARVTEKQAVPTVEEELLLSYIRSDRLIDQQALDSAAKVIGNTKGIQLLTADDPLYISGKQTEEKWGIYRPVETYHREEVGTSITALRLIATGSLDNANSDYSGLSIATQTQEIMHNDIALPIKEKNKSDLSTIFYPQPSPIGSDAKVMGNIEGIRFSVSNQVVVIDRGRQDQLHQGSVFDLMERAEPVFQHGEDFSPDTERLAKEIELPSTKIGELMVIRPYDLFSLALITNSQKPIHTSVIVESPLTTLDSRESSSSQLTSNDKSTAQ